MDLSYLVWLGQNKVGSPEWSVDIQTLVGQRCALIGTVSHAADPSGRRKGPPCPHRRSGFWLAAAPAATPCCCLGSMTRSGPQLCLSRDDAAVRGILALSRGRGVKGRTNKQRLNFSRPDVPSGGCSTSGSMSLPFIFLKEPHARLYYRRLSGDRARPSLSSCLCCILARDAARVRPSTFSPSHAPRVQASSANRISTHMPVYRTQVRHQDLLDL